MARYRVYRGVHGKGSPLSTRLGSLTFCETRETATYYALHPNALDDVVYKPRVLEALVDINKPVFYSADAFVELRDLVSAVGKEEAKRVALKFDHYIRQTDNWEYLLEERRLRDSDDCLPELLGKEPRLLYDLYFQAWPYLDDAEEIERLKAKGYDGAVYRGSGASLDEREYRTFSYSQIMTVAVYPIKK